MHTRPAIHVVFKNQSHPPSLCEAKCIYLCLFCSFIRPFLSNPDPPYHHYTLFHPLLILCVLYMFFSPSVRARSGRQRHVQSAVQQTAEADAAGRMQYGVHNRRGGGENVEFNCG